MKIRQLLPFLLFCFSTRAYGQDPHFSQFFISPQSINPANTGNSEGAWRLLSNYRQQWLNTGTRFNSFSLNTDVKLLGLAEEENTLALGLSFLSDRTMNGAFSNTYTSGSLAYHLQLNAFHRLGMGIQTTYGTRNLDFNQLTFGEQFLAGEFDISLPNGENALTSLKPFLSTSAGLVYTFKTDQLDMSLGTALFHFNKPIQSFTNDSDQTLPVKQSANLSATYTSPDQRGYHLSGIYQKQGNQLYFSIGGATGIQMARGESNKMLWAGIWYRNNDVIYPYLGIIQGNFQLGLSYDISISKQVQANLIPTSFEFSLVLRPSNKRFQSILCPWK